MAQEIKRSLEAKAVAELGGVCESLGIAQDKDSAPPTVVFTVSQSIWLRPHHVVSHPIEPSTTILLRHSVLD